MSKFLGAEGGDGEIPADTYTLEETRHGIFCDCPASSRGVGRHSPRVTCKHVGWLERWLKLHAEGKLTEEQAVYYDSKRDGFFPIKGLNF